ncbi:MAG TPA: efflux RND transporter periplasmic adaptor subunit, partial [Gammaproteobacteria bacterium]
MNRNLLYTVAVVATGTLFALLLLLAPDDHYNTQEHDGHGHQDKSEDITKGPQGGRLLQSDNFALELKIFEKGVPPEFHIYSYKDGKLLNPADVTLVIKLSRLDGQIDTFNFQPQHDYLRGDGIVTEPHSFDITVEASHGDKNYKWKYENYEGRVQISNDIATNSGIKTELAGPQTIKETLNLTGRVQTDPNRLSQVRARFQGIVIKVQRELGDVVRHGDVLAEIQSNESLQNYTIKAPINGVIVSRDVQVNEITSDAPLFII